MIKPHCPNINLLWGQLLIEELYRLGVTHFCIAPGSRSSALTLAVKHHPQAISHCHFDERGLGFFALGLAKSSKQPIVIIVTSGTAVANLLPAVIEAYQTNIPLIVLTADRPEELINCGANQAINQQHIFSNAVVADVNIGAPTTDIPPSYLLTSIDNTFAQMRNRQGPIHINCMFRDPFYPNNSDVDFRAYLAPIDNWLSQPSPYTVMHRNESTFKFSSLLEPLTNSRVLVVLGQLPTGTDVDKIIAIAQKHHWPILADCQSCLVNNQHSIHYYDQLLHIKDFDTELNNAEHILQFGGRLLSKRLLAFIKTSKAEYWFADNSEQRLDPDHQIRHRFLDVNSLIKALDKVPSSTFSTQQQWLVTLQLLNQKIAQWLFNFDQSLSALTPISEYQVMRNLLEHLPNNSTLFLGNSMPIRLFDMFASPSDKQISIHTNRGASGIDGIVATTAGIATALDSAEQSQSATTLVIGDTSFLHDLNSLALITKIKAPLIILIFNNDGGAIFNMLPVPDLDNLRQDYYQMPHGLTFAKACELFSVKHCTPKNLEQLRKNLSQAYQANSPMVIEIIVPPSQSTDIVKDVGRKLDVHSL